MQYQLAQDTLTWLFNSLTLTSLLAFSLLYVYTFSIRYKQQNIPGQTPQNSKQKQSQQTLWDQQNLKQSQQELQEAQQSLGQAYQANLQMQMRLEAINLELQQVKHEMNQCQE